MTIRKTILGLIGLLLFAGVYVVGDYFYERQDRVSPADPQALEALVSTAAVDVSQTDWWIFEPVGQQPVTGLIFYPGGEVDALGYAELLHAVAAKGYLVVLVPMPLQLAVLAPDKAADVIAAFPEIDRWAIAGHSLGGAMAARYVYKHPGELNGLLFWDAYPPDTDDISERQIPVWLIHRSDQSGDPPDYYADYRHLLPADMQYRSIRGGNHINFGRFIPAERFADDAASATLTIDEQHRQIVEYTLEFLAGI